MSATIQWDYSIEDAKDDTGVDDDNIVGDEDEIWNYVNNIALFELAVANERLGRDCGEEALQQDGLLGNGWCWFDTVTQTESLRQSVDLSTRKFSTKPRPYDGRPAHVPAQHPIRAIAQVLHQAPPNSTVRI
jgi:hypothetical protein